MFDLPTTNDRKHVRSLMQDISKGHAGQKRSFALCDMLQSLADLELPFGRSKDVTALLRLSLLFCLEGASTKGAPRCQRHPLISSHRNNVALEIAIGGTPATLVDAELPESMIAGVLIRFGNDPGGGVTDAEIQHFSLLDKIIETLHDFLD